MMTISAIEPDGWRILYIEPDIAAGNVVVLKFYSPLQPFSTFPVILSVFNYFNHTVSG